MPVLGSWAELHAALTHFSIALLLTALFFDAAALVLRRPAWRSISLAILSLAVVSLPFALLSGYLAGRDMGRPPVGFDAHWKAAVLTFAVAALLLLWRVRTRSRTERLPQVAMMGLALASAIAVGYTGHMGGAMVYGGRSSEEVSLALAAALPSGPPSGAEGTADKVAQAAGRMEKAAGRRASATDRLANRAVSQPASQPKAPQPPASTSSSPPSALDDATQKLDRVAARFEASATKMEAAVRTLQARDEGQLPPASPALTATSSVATSNATPATQPTPAEKAPIPTAPVAPPPDPQLAAGRKLFFDDEIGWAGCHKISGQGGRSGPDLTFAGRLHPDISWQLAHLKNQVPNSSMPAYADLPQPDLAALSAFLASLK